MDLLKQLDQDTLTLLKAVGKIVDEQFTHAFLVGGPVRDAFLKLPAKDIDIVIEGSGIAVAKEFARAMQGKVQTFPAFKTATVTLEEGRVVDFATARAEIYVRPGAFPKVTVATIYEDLYRRDFTINAIAVSINAATWGAIYDPYEGLKDLKQKYVRVLHDQSFIDDPTRILRAIRFKERFGFKFEKHTDDLLDEAIANQALSTIRPQRYKKEYDKILQEKKSSQMLKSIKDRGATQGKSNV